jgi:hypothetical protein
MFPPPHVPEHLTRLADALDASRQEVGDVRSKYLCRSGRPQRQPVAVSVGGSESRAPASSGSAEYSVRSLPTPILILDAVRQTGTRAMREARGKISRKRKAVAERASRVYRGKGVSVGRRFEVAVF